MRTSLLFAAVFCASVSIAQPAGSYNGTAWSITPARTLLWGGQPYMPMGWRIPGNTAAINAAAATGLGDVIIDAPGDADWKALSVAAEKSSLRYLIANAAKAPMSAGYIVRPSAYRIEHVPRTADFSIPIPEGRSVFYLLLNEPDFSLANQGWSDVVGGHAKITVSERISGGGYLLLLYPRVNASVLPDFWEGFDSRRDSVLAKAKNAGFGPGLRGFIDPVGSFAVAAFYEAGIVPDSQLFRIEFEGYLKTKYQDVGSLERAWRLSSAGVKDIRSAARLIALFGTNGRGVDKLLDPVNNSLVSVDRNTSAYWKDVQAVIENAASRRTKRMATALRQVVNVPVVIDWHGWSPVYDSGDASGDGIGITASGQGVDSAELAASAASSGLSWSSLRWSIATGLGASGMQPFSTESALRSAISDVTELGAKGWFVRWTGGSEALWLKTIAEEAKKDSLLASRSPVAMFYPENARFPAVTMRLPGGVWWLPTPASGERLDLGPSYEGYRHSSKFSTFTALWRQGAPMKVKLIFKNPEMAIITRYDGAPIETKLVRDGVEVTVDSLPLMVKGVDEIPVPEDALNVARADYQSLLKEARRLQLDIGAQRFAYEEAFRNFDRNPGVSFGQMMDALRNLQLAIAPYYWIEGEASTESSFGEIASKTATSNNRALVLSSPMKPDTEGYFAKYRLKVGAEQAPLDFWLAARIPDAVRPYVTVEVNGTRFSLKDAQSGYSKDFAWYSLGRLTIKKGTYSIAVRVSPDAPKYEMAIDALLATPLAFRPQGPKVPRYVPGG